MDGRDTGANVFLIVGKLLPEWAAGNLPFCFNASATRSGVNWSLLPEAAISLLVTWFVIGDSTPISGKALGRG